MVVRAARRRRGRPESSGHPARASQRGVAGAMPVGQGEQNNVAGAVSRATAVTTSPWLGSLKIPPEMWTSRLARSPREARPGEREGGRKATGWRDGNERKGVGSGGTKGRREEGGRRRERRGGKRGRRGGGGGMSRREEREGAARRGEERREDNERSGRGRGERGGWSAARREEAESGARGGAHSDRR